MTQLPDPQTVEALVGMFETLRGGRPDPVDAAHRRGLERLVARLAVASVAVLVLASAWVAVDPQDRYNAEHRQLGLQGLVGVAAALVGAVAGYLARSKP